MLPFTLGYQADIRSCRLLDDPSLQAEALVAVAGDRIIGIAIYGPTQRADVWTIRMLAIVRNWQRQGLGTELKQHVLAEVAHRGSNKISSSVHEDNEPMRALNDALGIPFEIDRSADSGERCFYPAVVEIAEVDEVAPGMSSTDRRADP
jgi:GNAT superfamily N-acetyltransferase